jgi:hypothetical protein
MSIGAARGDGLAFSGWAISCFGKRNDDISKVAELV